MHIKRWMPVVCLHLMVVLLCNPAGVPAAPPAWQFVQLSDLHMASPESQQDLRAVLADLKMLAPTPDFLLVTGDVTDMGTAAEFRLYKQIMDSCGFVYHTLLGNHDSRWSGLQTTRIEALLGAPVQFAFLHNNAQIIGLNSALPLEAWGDVDQAQIHWLRQQLGAAPSDAIRIVALHHPPRFPQSSYLSDNPDFYALLDSFKVALCLNGHGHSSKAWTVNGLPLQMAPAVMKQRSYLLVTVDRDSLLIESRTVAAATIAKRKVATEPARTLAFAVRSVRPGAVLEIDLQVAPELLSAQPVWELSRNNGPWISLAVDSAMVADTLALWPLGWNQVTIRCQTRPGHYVQHSRDFMLDGPSCRVLWSRGIQGRIQAAPLLLDGRLYLASGDGRLLALHPGSGDILWERPLQGGVIKGFSHGGGSLFTATARGVVSRHDPREGEVLWQRTLPAAITAAPRWADSALFVGTGSGAMYCLDANDGRIHWRFVAGEHIQAQPACHDGLLFFGSWDRHFYALDALTGKLVWNRELASSRYFAPATPAPAAADGRVIFVRAAPAPGLASVFACRAGSGAALWSGDISSHYAAPLIWHDRVILGGLAGLLYAVDFATGEKLWQVATGSELFDSSPVAVGDEVFIATVKGAIWRVDMRDGRVLGRYQAGPGLLFATLCVDENVIYAADVSGNVVAIAYH